MFYPALLPIAKPRQVTGASPVRTLLKHLRLEARASATVEDLYSHPHRRT